MTEPCFCDSNKNFKQCCEPFLKGNKVAKTPKQLMRSRYTAYASGNQGEYLLATWAPESCEGLTAISLSDKTYDWIKLEIIDSSQKGNEGRVEFKAYYKTDNGLLNVLHEKSAFIRRDGRWFYVNGEVKIEP
ncbi:MAG: Zn-binding protein [Proteobacteria bacterium]|nr:Zn-binding protein [Pseudomonadota bacterium]NOG60020.1 Zn-binding protein [Pseudomonadota bacterium]